VVKSSHMITDRGLRGKKEEALRADLLSLFKSNIIGSPFNNTYSCSLEEARQHDGIDQLSENLREPTSSEELYLGDIDLEMESDFENRVMYVDKRSGRINESYSFAFGFEGALISETKQFYSYGEEAIYYPHKDFDMVSIPVIKQTEVVYKNNIKDGLIIRRLVLYKEECPGSLVPFFIVSKSGFELAHLEGVADSDHNKVWRESVRIYYYPNGSDWGPERVRYEADSSGRMACVNPPGKFKSTAGVPQTITFGE